MPNAQGPGLCSTSVDKKDDHVCSLLVHVVCCNLIRVFFLFLFSCLTFDSASATAVSRLPAGCRIDASSSCPLDSASASQRATSAYRGPVASCPLVPLLPFASRLPAGCCVACCRVPPPRIALQPSWPLPPLCRCHRWWWPPRPPHPPLSPSLWPPPSSSSSWPPPSSSSSSSSLSLSPSNPPSA